MSAAPEPVPLRRALGFAALGAVAVLLSALAFRGWQDEAALDALLARLQLGPLLLAAGVMSLGMHFVGLRWRALTPGAAHVPAVALTALICAGLLLNVSLPGPVGELVAAGLMARRYGVPGPVALAGSVHGRVVGLASAGVLAGGAFLFGDLPIPPGFELAVGLSALTIAAGAAALGVLSARPDWLIALSGGTLGRMRQAPGRAGRFFARLDVLAQELAQGLFLVGRLGARAYAEAVGWAMCGHLCVAVGLTTGAWALGLDPHLPGVVFTYCAATAAVVVLFAVPGAQLGWDALFATLFAATCGVELADALLVVALVRAQQLVLLAVGAVSLTVLGAGGVGPGISGSPSEAPAPHHR